MSRRPTITPFLVILALFLAGCAGGPRGPEQGTPEWHYKAAQDSFRLGDWDKTEQHLEKIEARSANPFLVRAAAWHMVLETGLLLGNQELGEAYLKGWDHADRHKPDFMTEKMNSFREARRHAMHLAEAYDRFVKTASDKPILLEFPFPKGSSAPTSDLERIYNSIWPPSEQRDQLHDKVLDRGMVRAVSAVLTGIDDAAGAQSALGSGRAEAPSAKFLLAMGQSLSKTASLFARQNLSEPEKMSLFYDRALDAAKRVQQMKTEPAVETEAKKLQEDCEKHLKSRKA